MPLMRQCPDCRGNDVPCYRCKGMRVVPGEPRGDEAKAGRVKIIQAIRRNGPRHIYERLRGR